MASIRIKRGFTMPRDQLIDEVDRLAASMQEQWQLNCEWQSDHCLNFTHSGAKGQIEIGDSEFEIRAELGFLMGAFSSTIEAKITQFLDENVY